MTRLFKEETRHFLVRIRCRTNTVSCRIAYGLVRDSEWLTCSSPVTGFLVTVVSWCLVPPNRPSLVLSVCETSHPIEEISSTPSAEAATKDMKAFIFTPQLGD